MSLAPAERRALNEIEDSLRRSDRRLARMLTRFMVPLSRGGLLILVRRPRRRRRLIVSAVGVTAALLLVVAILRAPVTPQACSVPSRAGSAAAATLVRNCPLTLHEGPAASTAQHRAAGSSGDQGGP
ncbi:MAG: DUF3040 domain-containing protein [Actinomycetota bacterium]|nr:DUF3040 domain-containing protein [Actinomycetota bacterium]